MQLRWSGKDEFNAAEDTEWSFVSGTSGNAVKAGNYRSASAKKGEGKLTFLQVYEAGHMVPMDQPEVALEMLNAFLQGRVF